MKSARGGGVEDTGAPPGARRRRRDLRRQTPLTLRLVARTRRRGGRHAAVLMVFDLLHLDGRLAAGSPPCCEQDVASQPSARVGDEVKVRFAVVLTTKIPARIRPTPLNHRRMVESCIPRERIVSLMYSGHTS